MNGRELSAKFYETVVSPLLLNQFYNLNDQISVSLIGDGSEVPGFDDEISKDHNFTPRLVILLDDTVPNQIKEQLYQTLIGSLPSTFEGVPVLHTLYRKAIIVEYREKFFSEYLSIGKIPTRSLDWFAVNEQSLFELTSGVVFVDPKNKLRSLLQRISYYPDDVRNYLLYTGFVRLSEVNAVERAIIRKDAVAVHFYQSQFVYYAIHVFHVIHKAYCPYQKWMGKSILSLPDGEIFYKLLLSLITTDNLELKKLHFKDFTTGQKIRSMKVLF